MQKIEAIIRQEKFDLVRDALATIGVKFFTLKSVKGFGLQKGETHIYRGHSYGSDYIARLQLDIIVTDDIADEVIDTIMESARSGEVGDGKIMTYALDKVYRIRNGELNEAAL